MRTLVLGLAALVLLAPREARAWANAQVSTASAQADVAADGTLHARLRLTVRVLGGWLTELEVAGLDRGLVLDETTAATFTRASGEAVPFELTSDATGRIAFRFRNGSVPRVGDYLAEVAYVASIAEGGVSAADHDRVRYAWTFPAWASGLDAVSVTFRAPMGAVVERTEEDALTGVTVESTHEGTTERIVLRRLFLPRSVPWTVAFTLPRASVPVALRPEAERRTPRAIVAASRDGRPQPSTRIVCAVFALVALVKHLTFVRRARARGATPRPLVPIRSSLLVVPVILGACIAAATFWSQAPEVALGALTVVVMLVAQRPALRTQGSRLGAFRISSEADVRSSRWSVFVDAVSPASFFDASRALGLLVGLALVAGLTWLHLREPADSIDSVFTVPHSLALLGLLFVVGGQGMIPRSVDERLLQLEGVARSLRLPEDGGRHFAFRLAVHRDAHDVAQDARLRLSSAHRAPGLVRLDVAIVERATLGGYVAVPVLLVVVRQGSEAERILSRALPSQSVKAAPGGRRARVLPLRPSTWATVDRLARAEETARVSIAASSDVRTTTAGGVSAML